MILLTLSVSSFAHLFILVSPPIKDCTNADENSDLEETFSVLECADSQTVVNIDNDYGFTDQALSKRSWQIAVGDTKIEASFSVTLAVFISSNVGDVIEVTTTLLGTISGDLTLSLGTSELLAFTTWLAGLTSIFDSSSEGFIEDFFIAEASFDAEFSASVEPSSPFNLLGSASAEGGFAEPFVIDFLSNETGYPNITFDVEIGRCFGFVQRAFCPQLSESPNTCFRFQHRWNWKRPKAYFSASGCHTCRRAGVASWRP